MQLAPKGLQIVAQLYEMKLSAATVFVQTNVEETFSCFSFPSEHRRSLRTNNPLERIMREIRRRTRIIVDFPDGKSAFVLVSPPAPTRRRQERGTMRYMDMGRLCDLVQVTFTPQTT